MKYMGSKRRIAKDIIPYLLRGRRIGQYYVEPFMGGCNVIDKVKGNRIANDINKYLVEFTDQLANHNYHPPKDVSPEKYEEIKNNIDKFPARLVGYVGFQLSFGAMWFSSYRKSNPDNEEKDGLFELEEHKYKEGSESYEKRVYSKEAIKNVIEQGKLLKGIEFYNLNYWEVPMPEQSIIYCDPPYEGTTAYVANENKFDHAKFWEWCRTKTKEGNWVYISEYNAPDDFECMWSKEICSSLAEDTGAKKAVEKLFRYRCPEIFNDVDIASLLPYNKIKDDGDSKFNSMMDI